MQVKYSEVLAFKFPLSHSITVDGEEKCPKNIYLVLKWEILPIFLVLNAP